MVSPEAGAEQGARTTSPNGQALTDPPSEVEYSPLKLDKLRTKSNVLKGVWTDPSRIPVLTRPEPNTWVRVRGGEEYSAVIDLMVATNASNSNDRNPLYVATDDVRPELERFVKPHRVAVGVTYHDKVEFLWTRSVGSGDNTWTASVMRAMDRAETHLVTLESDRVLNEYRVNVAPRSAEWGEPKWHDRTLEDVLGLAFRDRIINSMDHDIVKRLLGLD
jgi:hypothetical protein